MPDSAAGDQKPDAEPDSVSMAQKQRSPITGHDVDTDQDVRRDIICFDDLCGRWSITVEADPGEASIISGQLETDSERLSEADTRRVFALARSEVWRLNKMQQRMPLFLTLRDATAARQKKGPVDDREVILTFEELVETSRLLTLEQKALKTLENLVTAESDDVGEGVGIPYLFSDYPGQPDWPKGKPPNEIGISYGCTDREAPTVYRFLIKHGFIVVRPPQSQQSSSRVFVTPDGYGTINDLKSGASPKSKEDLRIATNSVDPRRVAVVHGRNLAARTAMFTFLRAVNLDPLEWGEALAMTGISTPSIAQVLDAMFSNVMAVVVLLTGDDVARLGTRYLEPSDGAEEKRLTPQCRANVLFEAGMAFGRYPDRTILAMIGTTRSFSDIAGRHLVHLSNQMTSRQGFADRLRTAGCNVKTEHRTEWHHAGDFDSANVAPDLVVSSAGLTVLQKRPEHDPTANYKHKVRIEIRNDGSNCVEVRNSRWVVGPSGVKVDVVRKTLQLGLEGDWCPKPDGTERLKVPAGESFRTWVSLRGNYTSDEIRRLCEPGRQLGTLVLFVNGSEIEVAV